MIKLTQTELDRAQTIFRNTFQVICEDIGTLEDFDWSNLSCMELCVDYVYAYSSGNEEKAGANAEFMRELYGRVGYGPVIKQLCKAFSLV